MAPAKILVPTDGSDCADRALSFALELARAMPGTKLELLNVQPGVRGTVSMFISESDLKAYHREEAEKVLEPSLARVTKAGIAHGRHIAVGDPGPVIAALAEKLGCSQIVMGRSGAGGALGSVLGSVADDVLGEAEQPVTLVK